MKNKTLRSGFTTGTAAAAAAKAAVSMLMQNKPPQSVSVELLTGDRIQIPILNCTVKGNTAECTVKKDAGDDPDITHNAIIGACVAVSANSQQPTANSIRITGGYGVGKITKPGLEIPPGEPAINPGPRKMITQAVEEVLQEYGKTGNIIDVEIFVPDGITLAQKTLNARLGIIGGISILGTTGIVKPLSHEAYTATIKSALSVAKAAGVKTIVFTTGRRSERFAQSYWQDFPSEAFIQIGDYFKDSVTQAVKQGFGKIILAVLFGKAVKMAQGFPNTHAANAQLDTQRLAEWAFKITQNNALCEEIRNAVTARHVLDMIKQDHQLLIHEVGRRMIVSAEKFADSEIPIESTIFDYDGNVLCYQNAVLSSLTIK